MFASVRSPSILLRRAGLLVVAAAVSLSLAGCWEKVSTTTEQSQAGPDPFAAQRAALNQRQNQALQAHHDACATTFINQPGFGISRLGPLHARLKYPSTLEVPAGEEVLSSTPAGQPLPEVSKPWKVTRMDLIGTNKGARPYAYEAGATDEPIRSRPPRRDLDEFEAKAVTGLENGEQVLFLKAPDEIRMVGAVRASKKCTECHQVKEGALLGAMSYTLVPAGR